MKLNIFHGKGKDKILSFTSPPASLCEAKRGGKKISVIGVISYRRSRFSWRGFFILIMSLIVTYQGFLWAEEIKGIRGILKERILEKRQKKNEPSEQGILIQEKPQPPEQPQQCPGGKDYLYQKVIKNVYGEGKSQYWIFYPDAPELKKAPLIIFVHGWGAVNPMIYGAWIEHIVRKGNIVVYPRYQESLQGRGQKLMENIISAVKSAIDTLNKQGQILPDLSKVAFTGHSAGGGFAANLAVLAKSSGLPSPKAVMCVQPCMPPPFCLDFGRISKEVLLLVIIGADDTLKIDYKVAEKIFNESSQISMPDKDFVIVNTDDYGYPPLLANHASPLAVNKDYDSGKKIQKSNRGGLLPSQLRERIKSKVGDDSVLEMADLSSMDMDLTSKSVNALDYYGYWKLFDALCDAAFYGKNREYALGNTPQQRSMGKWSDGTPVKELVVADKP